MTDDEIRGVRVRAAAGRVDLFCDGGDAIGVTVDEREAGAGIGEDVRGRSAHAAGGARDDRDAPFDRSAEFAELRHAHGL